MSGFKDKLGDLSWIGLSDQGWFEVGPAPEEVIDKKKLIDDEVEFLLKQSSEMVASDNINVTKQQRIEWIEYRKKLREIYLQPDYPNIVHFPQKP